MKLFLDTSSLVNVFHREAGTDDLAAVVDRDDYINLSLRAYEQFPATVTLSIVPPCVSTPVERSGVTSNQVNDSRSVLESILQ
jgi:hypothetical protein